MQLRGLQLIFPFSVAVAAEPPVRPLHQVPALYPTDLMSEGFEEVRCAVDVTVGTDGVPADVVIAPDCPPSFALAVGLAVHQWRYAPRDAPATVSFEILFPERPPIPAPLRDFFVGMGPVYAAGEGSGRDVPASAALVRLHTVFPLPLDRAMVPAAGLEVDARTTRPGAQHAAATVGVSVGGNTSRGSVRGGIGWIGRGTPWGDRTVEWHLPLAWGLQADAGTVRLHLRGQLWWILSDGATARAPSLVPTTGGGEIVAAATVLVPSGFDPRFGPRVEIGVREEFGHLTVTGLLGVGL